MSHTNYKEKGRASCSLLLYGDGDGGGGPKVPFIESVKRLRDLDGVPRVKMSTVDAFFDELETQANRLCTWEGELFLELHNGTYTTMAENKKANREIEITLRDLEMLYALIVVL